MKQYSIRLRSITPYSQSRFVSQEELPMEKNEKHDDYEKRMWPHRMHVLPNGNVCIPPMSLKNAICDAASELGRKFKGQRTYGPIFLAGIMCADPVDLGIKQADVPGEWLHLNADGKRGGNRRVMRCYPKIATWSGTLALTVLNEAITAEILEDHIEYCGMYVGIGRFRPINGGFYGRFEAESIKEE